LGNAFVESPPCAQTIGGLAIHPQLLSRIWRRSRRLETNASAVNAFERERDLEEWASAGTHAVEAAEAEVEEDRGDEREGSKEEEQAEEAAGR
jgi:hypothetical protein